MSEQLSPIEAFFLKLLSSGYSSRTNVGFGPQTEEFGVNSSALITSDELAAINRLMQNPIPSVQGPSGGDGPRSADHQKLLDQAEKLDKVALWANSADPGRPKRLMDEHPKLYAELLNLRDEYKRQTKRP